MKRVQYEPLLSSIHWNFFLFLSTNIKIVILSEGWYRTSNLTQTCTHTLAPPFVFWKGKKNTPTIFAIFKLRFYRLFTSEDSGGMIHKKVAEIRLVFSNFGLNLNLGWNKSKLHRDRRTRTESRDSPFSYSRAEPKQPYSA